MEASDVADYLDINRLVERDDGLLERFCHGGYEEGRDRGSESTVRRRGG